MTDDLRGELQQIRIPKTGDSCPYGAPGGRIAVSGGLTIEIVEVRVQRLHDISEDDARAEGVRPCSCYQLRDRPHEPHYCAFAHKWIEIYGADSWDANPWVWAITFKRVEP